MRKISKQNAEDVDGTKPKNVGTFPDTPQRNTENGVQNTLMLDTDQKNRLEPRIYINHIRMEELAKLLIQTRNEYKKIKPILQEETPLCDDAISIILSFTCEYSWTKQLFYKQYRDFIDRTLYFKILVHWTYHIEISHHDLSLDRTQQKLVPKRRKVYSLTQTVDHNLNCFYHVYSTVYACKLCDHRLEFYTDKSYPIRQADLNRIKKARDYTKVYTFQLLTEEYKSHLFRNHHYNKAFRVLWRLYIPKINGKPKGECHKCKRSNHRFQCWKCRQKSKLLNGF